MESDGEKGETLELARKNHDIIYKLTDRREQQTLWHHVHGILNYLKQVYGETFEKFPEIIGDPGRRDPQDNSNIVKMFDRILKEGDYEILLMTFLLFLAFLKDVQDVILKDTINPDAYQDWLRYLYDQSRQVLEGVGDRRSEYIMNICIKYVIGSSLFLHTYREQPMIEGHSQ